jgi:hypothetical protein
MREPVLASSRGRAPVSGDDIFNLLLKGSAWGVRKQLTMRSGARQ